MPTSHGACDHCRPRKIGACSRHGPASREGSRRGSRGMVTFELAIGILSAGLAAVVLCWAVGLLTLHIKCADIAAQVARYAARGDALQATAARARAPAGSSVEVVDDGSSVTVVVQAQSSLGKIGPITMSGRATMPKEP